MHGTLNLLQVSLRLSRSLAVMRKQAMARAASSGVAVRRLVASRIRLREARMAGRQGQAGLERIYSTMRGPDAVTA